MMSENVIYGMSCFNEYEFRAIDCFVCAFHNDDRSVEGLKKLVEKGIPINNIIAICYGGYSTPSKILDIIEEERIIEITVSNSNDIIFGFKTAFADFVGQDITIDISCIRTPDVFSIFKLLRLMKHGGRITCLYSVPYDYEYVSGDFDYKASMGDLENYDLAGYGGNYNGDDPDSTYVVFLGFEGSLALKVLEEAEYRNLNFVNGLPPFYQKYKDISITNNTSAIKGKPYTSVLYTPSDNPFETYNMLERSFLHCASICVSPLGSKPVSLGVCLYALEHDNVRVVYPISESYSPHLTNEVIKTWVYDIPINLT